MDKNKNKKSAKRKFKLPALRKFPAHGGIMGGSRRWTGPPPLMPRRDYSYRREQKFTPKEEKSHWNGKVQVWTEPQKPRQEKIIKYEVDTDKLLNELARGNREALNEIAEKLKEKEVEPNPGESAEENPQKLDSPEKTEADSPEAEPNKADESLEPSDKTTETNEEVAEEKTETTEEKTDLTEPTEAEGTEDKQEMPQDAEAETEPNTQDPLDSPELVYMSPSFWEQLESEMSDELEQLEPEENLEIPQEEGEPFSEGY